MTCFVCNEQGHQLHECPRRRSQVSHQTNPGLDTRANVVKCFTPTGIQATNSTTRDFPIPPIIDTHQDTGPSTLPHVQEGHEKHETQTLSTDNPHRYPTDSKTVIHDVDTDKPDSNNKDEEDQNPVSPNLPTTSAPLTKWTDLISTDLEQERATDKQGKT